MAALPGGRVADRSTSAISQAERIVTGRPEIVCICGSIRFVTEMREANRALTFAGVIVLAPAKRTR